MHMRRGYYLKKRHYAYLGIKELAMKKLRSKENQKRKMDVVSTVTRAVFRKEPT